jgi:L-lactate dehydrogenase complex protein LldG
MSEVTGTVYDSFASRAADFGVKVTRVPGDEATAAIEAAIEEPVVAAPLPGDDLGLPDGVPTDPTPSDLDRAVTGVTAADLAIAAYGSIVLGATPAGTEPVSLFPDRHVAVLREQDIVADMAAAFESLGNELRSTRGSAVLATGPSATADMGELVKGAHGPKEVRVIVVQ